MAGEKTIKANGDAKLAFVYTAGAAKMGRTITNAAEALYRRGIGAVYVTPPQALHAAATTGRQPLVVKPFAELTEQQKIDILDAHLFKTLRTLAKENHVRNATGTAKNNAKADAEDKFI